MSFVQAVNARGEGRNKLVLENHELCVGHVELEVPLRYYRKKKSGWLPCKGGTSPRMRGIN